MRYWKESMGEAAWYAPMSTVGSHACAAFKQFASSPLCKALNTAFEMEFDEEKDHL